MLNHNPKALPHWPLKPQRSIAKAFSYQGVSTFSEAAEYIKNLPYKRTPWRQVLEQQSGTCSSKHALLQALADEQLLDCQLMLGIYEMTDKNTQGVGKVLEKYQLESIAEAHCFLQIKDEFFDFTFKDSFSLEPITDFLELHQIRVDDSGPRKIQIHKEYLKKRFPDQHTSLWSIREECISALFS